jgi:hypothetical protein
MKRLIILIISVVMTVGAFAQDIFFPLKEGLKLLYANLDDRGRVSSYSQQTISKVEGSGNNYSITYLGQVLDKNRKPTSELEIPFTITVVNGVVEWDMKVFAAPGTEGFIQVEGDKIRIPSSLAPGVKLEDVNFTITLNMGVRIRTEMSLTDQQCIAIENVTVPAGTFRCYKLTQTSTVTVMRRTTTTKTISWYALGIGTVKSETYNDKDKLQSSVELHAVE